jgi:hypothetical protein
MTTLVRGRRKNFLVALASINHSTTWNGGERGWKKKCPLHSTLKRVKVFFYKFLKEIKKGKKRRTKKLHFCRLGWGGRHCANAASLA